MIRLFAIFALAILALPAAAQDGCPALPDQSALKDEIYGELRIARDQTEARFLNDRLWTLWLSAPDAHAQGLLNEGTGRIRYGDYGGAAAALTALIDYCPDYAEGYNQRAFAAFLSGDFESALSDLDLALERDPRHLGALTGKARTLINLGRDDEGQIVLRDALRLNRWLGERALLTGPMEEEI